MRVATVVDPGPVAPAAPVRLNVAGRTLVLVAGIPGAGKSTLLARLEPRPGLTVLDSDRQRRALRGALERVGLAETIPYALYRPLVHLCHRTAVVRAAFGPAPTVVVHLPATSPTLRAAVAFLAACTRRVAHLVWLDVTVQEALAGQRARGRSVPASSFARHVGRGRATAARLRAGDHPPGWSTVTVLDRSTSAGGLQLNTQ